MSPTSEEGVEPGVSLGGWSYASVGGGDEGDAIYWMRKESQERVQAVVQIGRSRKKRRACSEEGKWVGQ